MVEYIKEDIQEVMTITGLDYTKAEKLFKLVANDLDDGTDDELCSYDVIDVIKAEQKVKNNGTDKIYATAEKPKTERKPREKKIDESKKSIIEILYKALVENGYNAEITNVDKTIDFGCYTVNLVKHRPPKK